MRLLFDAACSVGALMSVLLYTMYAAPAAPRGKQCLEGSLQLMQSLEQWRKPMFLVDGTVQ